MNPILVLTCPAIPPSSSWIEPNLSATGAAGRHVTGASLSSACVSGRPTLGRGCAGRRGSAHRTPSPRRRCRRHNLRPRPSASPTKRRMWRPSRPRTAARPVRQRGRPTGMGGGRSPAPRRATEDRGDGSARPPTPPPPATCAPPVTSAADGAVAHGCGGKLRPAAAAAAAIVLWCRRCRGAPRAPLQLSFFGHRRARGRGSRGCRLGVTSHGPCAMRRWRPLRRGWPHR